MKLSEIDVNKKFILKNIDFHGIKKRRLYDLGFIPGQVIEKMYDSVFKNPSCYKIKDTFNKCLLNLINFYNLGFKISVHQINFSNTFFSVFPVSSIY